MPRSTSVRTPTAANLARRIDLTTLQLFIAVCEEINLTRAAQREGIAPSAVSKRPRRPPPPARPTMSGRSVRHPQTRVGEQILDG